jgi:hypothetical protein
VALTAEDELSLGNAGLIKFFNNNKKLFREMATSAYAFAAGYVEDAGLEVRIDDVAKALEPALRVTPKLRTYLAGKKLTQQYWYRRFADLVLDRLWKELPE